MADFREKILDKVYTVGYNLWRVEAFAEQVKALDATVVDVRYRPNSRNPDWRAGSLLKRLGRAYVWMPEFGNRNYKGGPIELVNPEEGLAKLQEIERPILMCACASLKRCHRYEVAERVKERFGCEVVHLWPQKEERPKKPDKPILPPQLWLL